jgi:hypothetical protein
LNQETDQKVAVIAGPSGPELPALIAGAGQKAARRFLEFFTVNIRNKNTRAAYEQAVRIGSDRLNSI